MLQVLAISILVAGDAHAGFVCHKFDRLPFKVEDCDDNEPMGQEALDCVRSYYEHVQSAQADVLSRFQAQIAKLKQQQADSFDRTRSGYEDAHRRLEALVADGKVARASVDDLLEHLVYPEDYDQPAVTGKAPQAYLAAAKCYAIPWRVLQQSQVMIDKILDDLTAAENQIASLAGVSSKRSKHVQALDQGQAATGRARGEGHGISAGSRTGGGQSDITGVRPHADELPK